MSEARCFPKMEAHNSFKMESPEPDFLKMKASDVSKTEPENSPKMEELEFPKMNSPEPDFFRMEARPVCKMEPKDFPKMELEALNFPLRDLSLASDYLKLGPQDFPKKEKSECTSSTLTSEECIAFGSKQKISCKIEKDERIKNFISLLLSYPVRIGDECRSLEKWTEWKYVEGLVPKEIIMKVEKGERSIFDDDVVIPEAILNLSVDLAVDQLIQTLLFEHHHAPIHPTYIKFSTRSRIEKRAVMQKIEAALEDNPNMLAIRNAFHKTLRIDASWYESPVEHHVRQDVYQLLNPKIATGDSDILLTRSIEEEMSSNRYLVLLVDSDDEETLDPRKLGFSKTTLSGVVVLITTESSTQQDNDDLITEMDLEIRTEDHLLPWKVFCHNVGSEVVRSTSAIHSIVVRIVEECRGHLLAIVLVAKWFKNLQDVQLWELALQKMRYTDPLNGILKFLGLSRVMINTFINIIWDGMNMTQKQCLLCCLSSPKIKDGKTDYELTNDWVSSLLVEAEEAEHNLRELVDRCVLLQSEGTEGNYIRLPEETYEILQSLHTSYPLFIKKSGKGLTELSNTVPWHGAVRIDLADNKLSELPLDANWSEVKVLMLQGNADLTKIPPLFFFRMPLLCILDLSYTGVRELPSSFFNLELLRELYMKGCQSFMKLPPEIGKLHKLEKLDLDETQIIHLPREIQELTNMQSLTLNFYEYRGKKNKPYSCSTIIPFGVISKLKGLKHLSIDVNPDDERWHENVQVILPEILGLGCLQTLSLYVPQLELLKLIPARIFEVDFRFIVGCHKQRIMSSIPPTVNVKFKQSDCSLKFVKGVDVPSAIKNLLGHSKALFLDRHMTMKNLSEFGVKNLEQLRVCILAECKEMQTVVEGRNSIVNDNVLSHLLFLSVSHMKNLRSIWKGPTPPYYSFGMLQSLSLQSCPKLITLFSLDLAGNLSLLKELLVKDCVKLRTLIRHESSKLKVGIFLPKLRKLSLLHLPELISISNGLWIGPSLKEIGFYCCPKLQSLSWKELSSQELRAIKGETNWWKALKWSKTDWVEAGWPSKFDSIFSAIQEEADVMTQLSIYNDDDMDEGPGGSVGEPPQTTLSRGSYKKFRPARIWTVRHPLNDLRDGHAWSKYGQKESLGSKYPRSYYACLHKFDQGCQARKRVQRSQEDPAIYETTYTGEHTCNPNPSRVLASIDDSVKQGTYKGEHARMPPSDDGSINLSFKV